MEGTFQDRARLLRILGHPVRLRIVTELAGERACVKQIWERLDMPQAVVSQHLKVLKNNGLLTSRREGTKVCYALRDDSLTELVKLLGLA